MPLLATADLVAPSLMLGLAIGRIGCLLNGCCFGGLCDLPWAVTFPAGSPAYASQVARGVMYGFVLSGDPKASPRGAGGCAPLARPRRPACGPTTACDASATRRESVRPTAGDAHRTAEPDCSTRRRPSPWDSRTGGIAATVAAVCPRPAATPVHPTQIYSSIDALLICLLLLAYDPFRRRDGELSALMLTVYPIDAISGGSHPHRRGRRSWAPA